MFLSGARVKIDLQEFENRATIDNSCFIDIVQSLGGVHTPLRRHSVSLSAGHFSPSLSVSHLPSRTNQDCWIAMVIRLRQKVGGKHQVVES